MLADHQEVCSHYLVVNHLPNDPQCVNQMLNLFKFLKMVNKEHDGSSFTLNSFDEKVLPLSGHNRKSSPLGVSHL